jgi:hypothetical protein
VYAFQQIFHESYTMPTTLGVYRPSHHELTPSTRGYPKAAKSKAYPCGNLKTPVVDAPVATSKSFI